MFLNSKKVAIAGLLLAMNVLLMFLSTAIESSSLFFIAAASFSVGIVIREWGLKMGFGFLVASILLNLFISPNKLFCITLGGMETYLFFTEWLWRKIADKEVMSRRTLKLWIGKILIFNAIYLPILLSTKKFTDVSTIIAWAIGQVVFVIYDYAYRYFQGQIWNKIRKETFKFL